MTQSKLKTETSVPLPNENISVPYGLVRTVEYYLGSTGIFDLVDTFKERGVPLSKIVLAMCTCILMGSNSMTRCSDWLADPNVRKELGIDKNLSQRTINRALNILGNHSDEIVMQLWKGLDSRYRFDNTDVNIDGSRWCSTVRVQNWARLDFLAITKTRAVNRWNS